MSYARFTPDSDVYVFASTEGGYVCCMCKLEARIDSASFDKRTKTASQMIAHLREHRAMGYQVPDYTLEKLELEEWLASG